MPDGHIVEFFRRQMEDAWHTLEGALAGLTEEEFWWKPSESAWTLRKVEDRWILDYDEPHPIPKAPLTIAWLVVHLAACKIMYVEYAFGQGKLTWDELDLPSDMNSALDYLIESHGPLLKSLEELSDVDLPKMRRTNWGELWSTEKIIWTMIHHDIYHGAQINTLRKIFRAQHSSSQKARLSG
jgi:hypothetical protein